MALSHTSKVYAISDCKISKLTADASGGAPTYASAIDVPGIKSMEVGGEINTVELRGDNGPLDQNSVLGSVTVSVEHAKISLDVLEVLLGGTNTDSGTTPSQVSTFTLAGGPTFNYFKIEGTTPANGADSVGGDVHLVLYKCMLTSFPDIGFAEEDFRTVSFEAVAIPTLGTGTKILDLVLNETAVAIS